MKHTSNMIVMGFLVIGLWYSIGYLQGYDQSSRMEYQRGKEQGKNESELDKTNPDDV